MKTILEFTSYIEKTAFPESLQKLKECADANAVTKWRQQLCRTVFDKMVIGEENQNPQEMDQKKKQVQIFELLWTLEESIQGQIYQMEQARTALDGLQNSSIQLQKMKEQFAEKSNEQIEACSQLLKKAKLKTTEILSNAQIDFQQLKTGFSVTEDNRFPLENSQAFPARSKLDAANHIIGFAQRLEQGIVPEFNFIMNDGSRSNFEIAQGGNQKEVLINPVGAIVSKIVAHIWFGEALQGVQFFDEKGKKILEAGDILHPNLYKHEIILEEGERLIGIRSNKKKGTVSGEHYNFRFVIGEQT